MVLREEIVLGRGRGQGEGVGVVPASFSQTLSSLSFISRREHIVLECVTFWGLPRWCGGKEPACQSRKRRFNT